jgi:glucose/arabinose dehydrogenase
VCPHPKGKGQRRAAAGAASGWNFRAFAEKLRGLLQQAPRVFPMKWLASCLLILAPAPGAMAAEVATSAGPMQITAMATGLEEPWALAFLPDGGFLVTERDAARLWLYHGAARHEVTGLPQIATGGQGGLLDVMVPRDFAASRRLWLTYTVSPGLALGHAAALGSGRLSEDGTRLEDFRAAFVAGLMPGMK